MQINRRNRPHIALAPLPMIVRHLSLDNLEGIQSDIRLGDFETPLQDVGVFVLYHEELAVRVGFEQALEGAEVVYCGEEG